MVYVVVHNHLLGLKTPGGSVVMEHVNGFMA